MTNTIVPPLTERGSSCGYEPVRREHEGVTAVVIASVLSCPANKRTQKAKEFDYNTFKGIDCWIWDTGSGVDICGRE
jgi:hypothetical protein